MKREWKINAFGDSILRFLGYSAVIVETQGRFWYGICHENPSTCIYTSGSHLKWSEKKAKRKALKHMFRLPKRN